MEALRESLAQTMKNEAQFCKNLLGGNNNLCVEF